MKKEKEEQKNYTLDTQTLYLNMLMSDGTAFTRCQSILSPDHWHDRLKPAVRYILKFADEFRALPTTAQVKAEVGVEIEKIADIQAQHTEWFLKEIETFSRHRAVELVGMEGADLISEGRYDEYERKLKEALTISLQNDLGTSYFEDPKTRIQQVLDRQDVVSTGWKVLDDKLYGGFTKGALNIFAGGSGSGKSLFLQNLALNWSFMGHDVIYISLELAENLVAARLDSMITGFSTKEIFRKIADVDLKVRMQGKKAGDLKIKKFPEAGTTSNMLRAYLKEYEIQTGKKPTAMVVDYLDLMYPNNAKINPSDMFVKDKFVSEELRALASEFHLLFATASQLNRGSVEANGDFDHSHIAGGISKINTADNVFGIFTTSAMKERGEYQLQMLKTRSSAAVGQRIELGYDPTSLRITDPVEDADITTKTDSVTIGKQLRERANTTPNTNSKGNGDDSAKPPVASRPAAQPAAPLPKASPTRTNMMDILNKVRNS